MNKMQMNLDQPSRGNPAQHSKGEEIIECNREIKVGDVFINQNNGGQKVSVSTTCFQGMDGVIGYNLRESFRFSSVQHSSCEDESFRKTFSEVKK